MRNLLFLFIASSRIAQGLDISVLKEINIDGNLSTSENMVLYTAGLQIGQEVSSEDFRRAVKRLWELGVFNDIQMTFDENPGGGDPGG